MTATALSPARAKAIANAIAAFDNADEIAAILARTPDALISSAASLQTLLDDEAIDADADALFAAIAPHVGAKAPAPLSPMQHVNTAATRSTAATGLTANKLRVLFAKELAKSKAAAFLDTLTPELMACQHEFFGDTAAGAPCMVCRHETGVRVWKCEAGKKRAGGGCAIELCGSCAFKWKKAL